MTPSRLWMMTTFRRRRDAPDWRSVGEEPDYRFSLANERTFLAWIRTALAVMAAAVGVAQLVPAAHLHGLRRELGTLLAAVGVLICCTAYPHWAAAQRAMRLHQPVPRTWLLPVVAVILSLVGVGVVLIAIAE